MQIAGRMAEVAMGKGFETLFQELLAQPLDCLLYTSIRGNEEMPDATHNTTLPFTRYLAGAGDYTLCYFNNRVKNCLLYTSRCV